MARYLYTVPFEHEIPEHYSVLSLASQDEIAKSEERVNIFMKIISGMLKDKKIDVVFCEGLFRSYSPWLLPLDSMHRGVFEIAQEKDSRIEKTEDGKFHYFHGKIATLSDIVERIPLIRKAVRWVDYQYLRRRDYEMGKNVSKYLKENENGIIFYGELHKPTDYIKSFSQDIKIEPLF